MTGRLTTIAASLALSLILATPAPGQRTIPITDRTADAIRAWVEAINTHTPGTADDSVAYAAALSYEDREELNAGMALFLRALRSGGNNTASALPARAIVSLAHGSRQADANNFLKRAAVFHTDVAVYAERSPVPETTKPAEARPQEMRIGTSRANLNSDASQVPPLLTRSSVMLSQDGEVVGEAAESWNWPFARSLLDLVNGGRPASDPFVGEWYHATISHLFSLGAYGDLTDHLARAGRVLPDDARILFDRGCYAEALGLPMHQVLLSDRQVDGQRLGAQWTARHSAMADRIPVAEKTNGDAERLYRRAIGIEPAHAEARIRLARLLELRKRYQEAAAELDTALKSNPATVPAFYAHLFAGRTTQALGAASEAARHYEAALALFPDAQSALLAASQAALLASDLSTAMAQVARLGERSAAFDADPWWQYHRCAGRDVDHLLNDLWSRVPR
jgi:tetratricopeptide (TPR) repeat protein